MSSNDSYHYVDDTGLTPIQYRAEDKQAAALMLAKRFGTSAHSLFIRVYDQLDETRFDTFQLRVDAKELVWKIFNTVKDEP